MNKKALSKVGQKSSLLYETSNSPKNCPSAFTLTYVLEVVGVDVWHDCTEGLVDLGPPIQGVKLSYQLYTGQNFDVDVVIWPHVAKVVCGTNYGWVRTWLFLERRWLCFSIRHLFPVNVMDLRNFVATVTPNMGVGTLSANSKIVNITDVYLPPLRFGDRRQFSKIVDAESPFKKYIEDMIWVLVVNHIPISFMDGPFDTPYPVQDVRHQDAVLYQVQNLILNGRKREIVENEEKLQEVYSSHAQKVKPPLKEIKKLPLVEKVKYEIKLSGDWILAGIGRVTPFNVTGDRLSEQGEVIALISSMNLPAQDDFPVFFVNVRNLTDMPIQHLKQNRFTHVYTRWKINEEEHNSERHPIQSKQNRTEVDFNDHHSVPLSRAVASDVMSTFLDIPFRVEVSLYFTYN